MSAIGKKGTVVTRMYECGRSYRAMSDEKKGLAVKKPIRTAMRFGAIGCAGNHERVCGIEERHEKSSVFINECSVMQAHRQIEVSPVVREARGRERGHADHSCGVI